MTNLEPCDVIFVRRTRNICLKDRIVQYLVKWATGSPYFHVAYFVTEDRVFEANSFRTAGYASINDYTKYDVKRLELPLEVRQRILQRIESTGGASYGWGEVIALAFRLKLGINVFYDDDKRYICSEELVKAVFAECGVRIVDQTTGDVSPADLWRSSYLKTTIGA